MFDSKIVEESLREEKYELKDSGVWYTSFD